MDGPGPLQVENPSSWNIRGNHQCKAILSLRGKTREVVLFSKALSTGILVKWDQWVSHRPAMHTHTSRSTSEKSNTVTRLRCRWVQYTAMVSWIKGRRQ